MKNLKKILLASLCLAFIFIILPTSDTGAKSLSIKKYSTKKVKDNAQTLPDLYIGEVIFNAEERYIEVEIGNMGGITSPESRIYNDGLIVTWRDSQDRSVGRNFISQGNGIMLPEFAPNSSVTYQFPYPADPTFRTIDIDINRQHNILEFNYENNKKGGIEVDKNPPNFEKLKELIPGHNSNYKSKINLVFRGINYSNLSEFLKDAKLALDYNGRGVHDGGDASTLSRNIRINGIFGFEPFKSNLNKFNFYYIEEFFQFDIPEERSYCSQIYDRTDVIHYGLPNEYNIDLRNFDCSPVGSSGSFGLTVSTKLNNGNKDRYFPEVVVHEMGHLLGGLSDVYDNIFNYNSSLRYPLVSTNIAEASEWWKDMIGNGCGEDGIVDCAYNCDETGECSPGEYLTEVSYVAYNPTDCFDGLKPRSNCQVTASKNYTKGRKSTRDSIGFKAMTKKECVGGKFHCMYKDYSPWRFSVDNLMCYSPITKETEQCRNFSEAYPANGYWIRSNNVRGFIPHLRSIMTGPPAESFGPVGEKEVCKNLKEILPSISGICTTEYNI